MNEVLDELVIKVGVDDQATARLAAIIEELRAEGKALSSEHIKIKVDADAEKAKAQLAAARTEVKRLSDAEKEEARARVSLSGAAAGASTKRLNALRSEQQAQKESIRSLEDQINSNKRLLASVKEVAAVEKAANRQKIADQKQADRDSAAFAKAEEGRQKELARLMAANAKAEAARIKRSRKEQESAARALAAQAKQDEKDRIAGIKAAEKESAAGAARDAKQSQDALDRVRQERAEAERLAEVQRLSGLRRAQDLAQAVGLQNRLNAAEDRARKLSEAAGRAQGSDRTRFRVQAAGALADAEVLREKLKLLNRDPIDIRMKVDRSDVSEAEGVLGRLKSRLDRVASTGGDPLSSLRNKMGGGGGPGGGVPINLPGPLGNVPLHAALIGMGALAPVITGLIGALGSLISVLGGGLLAAAGVGGAALAGFAMAGVGITAMLKPQMAQFQLADTALQKYNEQVMLYGANSKQAQTAQAKLNSVLKQMSPAMRSAFSDMRATTAEWHKLTDATAAKDFGSAIGSTFKTVRADMGFFAKDSTSTLNAVTGGWNKWMADLRSSGTRGSLDTIFTNFNRSIPNIMDGLHNLGAALLNIFRSFSTFLPGLSQGFDKWAAGIKAGTENSRHMHGVIATLITDMRDVGHFTEAAVRFLLEFFKAGQGAGQGFLGQMTSGLSHLTDQIETTSGQNRLGDFFSRSVKTTVGLWAALMPLISAFVQLSQILAPIGNIGMQVVSFMLRMVAAVVHLVDAFKPLQAVIGVLAGLYIGKKLFAPLIAGAYEAAGAVGKLAMGVKALATGGGLAGFKAALGGGVGGTGAAAEILSAFETGGPSAAGEILTAMETGGASAAAEIGLAMRGGGIVGAGEKVASGLIPAAESAAAPVAEGVGAGAAAGAATTTVAAGVDAAAVGEVGALSGAMYAGAAGAAALGTALVAAAPVIAAVGAAALVTYGAIKLFGGGVSDVQRLQDNLNTELRMGAKVMPEATSTIRDNTNALSGLADAKRTQTGLDRQVTSGLNSLDRTQKAAGATGAKYKEGIKQVIDEESRSLDLQLKWAEGIQKVTARHKELARVVGGDVAKAENNQLDATRQLRTAQSDYNKALEGGNPRAIAHYLGLLHDAQKRADESTRNLTAAQRRQREVEALLTADTLNHQRALKGWPPIADRAAESVGKLIDRMKSAGDTKAVNFLVHLPNAADVQRISGIMNSLKNSGDINKALNVLSNAKNVGQALRELNAIQVHDKKLQVNHNIGATMQRLADLKGIQIPPKIMQLVRRGDTEALQQLSKILGFSLPPKLVQIVNDAQRTHDALTILQAYRLADKYVTIHAIDQATPIINGVRGAIAGINGQIQAIIGAVSHLPSPKKHATGGLAGVTGVSHDPVVRAAQERAARDAHRRPMQRAIGGMFKRPTYLVGEENRPEFVIATNPAYRSQNIGYLADAANEFGMHLTAAAHGKTSAKHPKVHKGKGKHQSASEAHNEAYALSVANQYNSKGPTGTPVGAYYPVNLGDRIGPIDISDLSTILSASQSEYSSATSKLSQMMQANASNATANKTRKHKRPPPYGSAALSRERGSIKKLSKAIGLERGFIKKASAAEDQFTALESSISAWNSALTVSENDPNGMAVAPDGKVRDFKYIKSQLMQLETKHTNELERAYKDTVANIRGGAPAIAKSKYAQALAAAVGQSLADEQTLEGTVRAAPTGESLSDFITLLGDDERLGNLNLAYTQAQLAEQANPGDPNAMASEVAAAKGLVTFYQDVYSRTQGWKNPATGQVDVNLENDAAQALLSAGATLRGIANVTGPTQQQLASTALYSLFQQYGSNTGNAVLQSGNVAAASGFDPLMTGTEGASAAARMLSPARSSTLAAGSQPTQHTDNSKTAHVTNYYQAPPDDPHTWSKSLSWEMEHAL